MSSSLFLIVDKSIGILIIFLYVGNCLVLTGSKKGQASSWHSRSSSNDLHAAKSFNNFLLALSFAFEFGLSVVVDGDPTFMILEFEISLWVQLVDGTSSFVVTELCDGAGLEKTIIIIRIIVIKKSITFPIKSVTFPWNMVYFKLLILHLLQFY